MKNVIEPATTSSSFRPRFEGANIRTWVGFKHFMYMVEEAVLQRWRQRGLGPGRLYHQHGLGLEVIDSSVQLPALLDIDDEVVAEVAETGPGRFAVTLRVDGEGPRALVARARLAVALVREAGAPASIAEPPASVSSLVVPSVAAAVIAAEPDLRIGASDDPESLLAPAGSGAFAWSWKARYFHCHYSDRVQHSAYVRALEEVVERFLADRGLSIKTMLSRRSWIPVVSRARVRLLADARMEETIHTVFAVEEILRDVAYQARMDCFVRRGENLVRCAAGTILHGYALSQGEGAGRLVELDPATQSALLGGRLA